ncbi:BglG family transcription antiterminator [Shouchella patagoniensis]|uniref:BglG family transcription antiterminator n=1 Tax=Shouchella patagoniensis TaxID=228576 RepID=UPI0009953B05|nr:BglG family transcription antiterminator [Shouchella patagoniensis]
MHVTARERVLLMALLDHDSGLTLKELAQAASVSIRTIQRDLPTLERTVTAFQLSLKKGHLLSLEGRTEAKETLRGELSGKKHTDLTSEERVSLLLAILLDAKEPVKLFTLAKQLNVASATVASDLTKAAEWLELFGIGLIRKRGYGVEVKGSETNIRRAMSSILAENLTEEAFYHAVQLEEEKNEVADRLLHFVDLETIRMVQMTVAQMKQAHFEHMSDHSYMALVVHVTLAIERIRQGEQIRMDADQLKVLEQEPSLPIAKKLAEALEQKFSVSIPNEEVGYLVMHLRGATAIEPFELSLKEDQIDLTVRVKKLISGMEEELNLTLSEPSLFQGLLAHFTPALYRVKHNMKIHNPLLWRIRADYGELFAATKRQASKAFSPLILPDEEIGFLTLHFGAVTTRKKQVGPLSALVVCSSGIGSAKMLSSRIKQEFPEIISITNASLFELENYNPMDFDLFISTVKVEKEREALHVSPVLTKDEVAVIRARIERSVREQLPMTTTPSFLNISKGKPTFADIARMAGYTEQLLQSVGEIEVDELEKGLYDMCIWLESKEAVVNASRVYGALRAREQLGGLAIPGTGFALFHTRTDDVKVPVFYVLTLKQNVTVSSMASGEEAVNRVLLMLAPSSLDEHKLSLMSFISILLIGSEDQTRIFQRGTIAEIVSLLEQKCREFLLTYINEGVD